MFISIPSALLRCVYVHCTHRQCKLVWYWKENEACFRHSDSITFTVSSSCSVRFYIITSYAYIINHIVHKTCNALPEIEMRNSSISFTTFIVRWIWIGQMHSIHRSSNKTIDQVIFAITFDFVLFFLIRWTKAHRNIVTLWTILDFISNSGFVVNFHTLFFRANKTINDEEEEKNQPYRTEEESKRNKRFPLLLHIFVIGVPVWKILLIFHLTLPLPFLSGYEKKKQSNRKRIFDRIAMCSVFSSRSKNVNGFILILIE